ncbi:MAG: LemA family protein [Verrucomicrobiota bacterium]
MTGLFILAGAGLIILIWWLATYNGFIAKRNQAKSALSSVDVNLKKRHDLIPNLINPVKGIMQHEKELLTKLTELREQAVNRDIESPDRMALESEIESGIGAIAMRAEAYPELQSSENFVHLQKSLNEVEEQISAARRAHNGAVEIFNNALEMFPSSIVGGAMSLKKMVFFEASTKEREPVKVDFS